MNGPAGPRLWLHAIRPATLSASVVPVLVGAATVVRHAEFSVGAFALALASAVLIQVGTNLGNDYSDHRAGADAPSRRGPMRLSASGAVSPRAVATAAAVAFALAAVAGLGLVALRGWPIIAIGLLAVAGALTYTGGPWPYGYHGLGDLGVLAFLGVLSVAGAAYACVGSVPPAALACAVPVGSLVTSILVVNNIRDIDTDRGAGKRTLAVLVGPRWTRVEYAALLLVGYLSVVALVALGVIPALALLVVLTAPIAIRLVPVVRAEASAAALNGALRATARLHLFFGAALALGIAVG